jgi:mono/diheme cytochrome c family protein
MRLIFMPHSFFMELLIAHKICVTAFLLIYLVKTILLVSGSAALDRLSKILKVPEMMVSAGFLITGIWMYTQIGAIKDLQIIKLIAVVASIPLAVVAFKKKNKALAVLSFILILASYGLAEMSKKKPYPAAKSETPLAAGDAQGIYNAQCSRCHGDDGAMGLLGATNLQTSVLSKQEALTVIKNGRKSMPKFEGALSDEQITQLADYIQGLRK